MWFGYTQTNYQNVSMDETGLFFHDTSKKTFHVKGNITIFLCPLFRFGLYFVTYKGN